MTKEFPDWKKLYEEQPVEEMPWYCASLDRDVEAALAVLDLRGGRVLDLGTGPGTQAFELAARGFRVTGSDLSPAAVRLAREKARARGLDVEFVADDILATALEGPFDAILDRGCFHVLPPERRDDYVGTVRDLLAPGGHLLLKTFSHEETREEGPYRFTPSELRDYFETCFEVLSIANSEFEGTLETRPKALFAILRRR